MILIKPYTCHAAFFKEINGENAMDLIAAAYVSDDDEDGDDGDGDGGDVNDDEADEKPGEQAPAFSSSSSSDLDGAARKRHRNQVGGSGGRERKRQRKVQDKKLNTREGTWPAHVRIELPKCATEKLAEGWDGDSGGLLGALRATVLEAAQPRAAERTMEPRHRQSAVVSRVASPHLSLSQPFALPQHQIPPFTRRLRHEVRKAIAGAAQGQGKGGNRGLRIELETASSPALAPSSRASSSEGGSAAPADVARLRRSLLLSSLMGHVAFAAVHVASPRPLLFKLLGAVDTTLEAFGLWDLKYHPADPVLHVSLLELRDNAAGENENENENENGSGSSCCGGSCARGGGVVGSAAGKTGGSEGGGSRVGESGGKSGGEGSGGCGKVSVFCDAYALASEGAKSAKSAKETVSLHRRGACCVDITVAGGDSAAAAAAARRRGGNKSKSLPASISFSAKRITLAVGDRIVDIPCL